MKPHTLHLDALDVMKELTIDVRVEVHGLWRLRLGKALLRLAGWVLRCPVRVVGESAEGEDDDAGNL